MIENIPENPNNYPTVTIHKSVYMIYEDETHDILETYNKKYKMRVRLRFPKVKIIDGKDD